MLLSQYPEKLKIVFKSFPSYQENARKLSAGAIAAFRQNKFWDFHNAIHHAEKPMPDGKVEEIANGLDLDMPRFLKDMEDSGTAKIIEEDINEGLSAHVFSVPTFFINGKHIRNEKLNDIYGVIESELKRLSKGS
jgi:protein-disulfide isomerase